MVRVFKMLAAAAFFSVFAAVSASAVPLNSAAGSAASAPSDIIQVHRWHHRCAWGPVRYHRHIPGIGNVRCKRHHWRKRCHRVRHMCADRWDWGNRHFRRCVRRRGC